ncbi:MAG: serine/threonine protein kinase [Anaerolineae bacterium]
MKIQAGTIVGKYKVEGVLGKGGMATVYKAVQQPLGRNVALKVLHSHLTAEKLVRERFLLEARAIASLKHPGIVQVYDYEASPEISYISMEYIDGGALDQQLEARELDAEHFKPLPVNQVLDIGRDIAEALDYAHQNGIIHRDVKPANILIGTDGRYVLTDFGIATLLHQNRMTADGATSGTPTYIPPEMITGDRGDERSDIYSLGIVMFQLLTGELPFSAENLYGVLMQHINQPVPSLSDLNPLVDQDVSEIVFKSLAKNANDRYQNGAELAEAIRSVLEIRQNEGAEDTDDALIVSPISGVDPSGDSNVFSRWLSQFGRWAWQLQALALVAIAVLLFGSFLAYRAFLGDPSGDDGPTQFFTPFVDSFDNNDAVWPTSGSPKWLQLVDGVYEMRIEQPDQVISSVPFEAETYQTFTYSAEIVQTDGPLETGSGLIFYYQDPLNYYVFGVNGYGQWSIWHLQEGVWQSLNGSADGPWLFSDTILPLNEWNVLRVEAHANDMDLYMNDQLLAEIPFADNLPREGSVGFYMATSREETLAPTVVKFDNLVVTP